MKSIALLSLVVLVGSAGVPTRSVGSAASTVAAPITAMYTVDAYGPVHPDGFSASPDTYPVFKQPLARAAHSAPSIPFPNPAVIGVTPPYSGLVLDAYGGLHVFNVATKSVPDIPGIGPYFPGQDIARDFVFLNNSPARGGYVLDGYGGIHPFTSSAPFYAMAQFEFPPTVDKAPYFPGHDIAKRIVMLPYGAAGYVLDGYGGIHPWARSSLPLPVAPSHFAYWPHLDIARDIWVDPASTATAVSGYVLDGYGGIHPFWGGTASAPAPIAQFPYFSGHDIARVIWLDANATSASSTGYVLDGYGGLHPFASAGNQLDPAITDHAYWPGRDLAIGLIAG